MLYPASAAYVWCTAILWCMIILDVLIWYITVYIDWDYDDEIDTLDGLVIMGYAFILESIMVCSDYMELYYTFDEIFILISVN